MKYTWRKKYELDIGTATPVDPQPLPSMGNLRTKYLKCPLCFESCSEAYWARNHGKKLHGQCPMCLEWFVLPNGLGQHLSRSQCGFNILEGTKSINSTLRQIIVHIK